MMPDRRRTFSLSVLASTIFWLAVDWVSRLPLLDPQEGFLSPIPGWKRLLLVAAFAGVLYATARLITAASSRRWVRLVLWPVALAMLFVGTHVWFEAIAEAYSPIDSGRAHMPLRFERPTLAGTAWWNVRGGECGSAPIARDVIVFETSTRVRRDVRYLHIGGYDMVVHALLGVWPHGERTDRGIVRDGAIYWDSGNVDRIEREGTGLRVTWAPLRDDR